MNHRTTMSACLSLVTLCAAALAAPADPPAPTKPVGQPMRGAAPAPDAKVVAEPAGLDFGVVPPHTLLEGDFKLLNLTAAPLKVVAAQPSCQCTTIDIVGKEIPPRGALDVPVTMKVSATGIKAANVKVVIEGVERPLTLDLRAEVAYAVRVAIADASGKLQPYVDAADDASRLRGVASVFSSDGKPFRVLSVQGETPQFVGWNAASDAPQPRYEVRFALPGDPCERVPKYLLIETDRADARIIDARVRHACTRITPALDIAEFRSNAGVIPAGASGAFDIEIKKMGDNRIESVRALDPNFEAELVGQKSDGASLMVTIRLKPGPKVAGVFMTPVRLVAVDAQGRHYMTQRPEATLPGQPPKILTLPSETDLLVYGKVE